MRGPLCTSLCTSFLEKGAGSPRSSRRHQRGFFRLTHEVFDVGERLQSAHKPRRLRPRSLGNRATPVRRHSAPARTRARARGSCAFAHTHATRKSAGRGITERFPTIHFRNFSSRRNATRSVAAPLLRVSPSGDQCSTPPTLAPSHREPEPRSPCQREARSEMTGYQRSQSVVHSRSLTDTYPQRR